MLSSAECDIASKSKHNMSVWHSSLLKFNNPLNVAMTNSEDEPEILDPALEDDLMKKMQHGVSVT